MPKSYDHQAVQRTRTGCTECKRKKVKCDLRQPVCSRCARWPAQCRYATNFVTFTTSTSRSVRSNSQDSPPQGDIRSIQLPQQISDHPSPYLQHHGPRFLMHHFTTQTCKTLFPFAPQDFNDDLIRTAVHTPHLLYATLTASCSHYTRLVCNDSRSTNSLTLEYTNAAIANLWKTLEVSGGVPDLSSALTAMMLCTNDVCHGDRQLWKTHLKGARDLLSAVIQGPKMVASDDHSFTIYLVKWYAALETAAAFSGHSQTHVPNDQHWSLLPVKTNLHVLDTHIDDICGYSLELWPFLAKIGAQTRSRDLSTKQVADDGTILSMESNFGFESEAIELGIIALLNRTVSPKTLQSLGPQRAEELRWTHAAFVHTALLQLYRRAQGLPANHEKVRRAILETILCLRRIDTNSPSNFVILWPIFSIGCETDSPDEREFVKNRMLKMKDLGLGNFSRALDVLEAYWISGSKSHWEDFVIQNQINLVLF